VKYLVDSDWVADYLKGRVPAVSLLKRLAFEGLAISILTFGEIYEGILFGENRPAHEFSFRNFLRGADILPLNRSVMRRFAEIRGNLRKTGQRIGDIDLLIAATALTYALTLSTRNVRHFQRISDLDLFIRQ
jgi:tRNA(fMet)-specific endonuclease VapC